MLIEIIIGRDKQNEKKVEKPIYIYIYKMLLLIWGKNTEPKHK